MNTNIGSYDLRILFVSTKGMYEEEYERVSNFKVL